LNSRIKKLRAIKKKGKGMVGDKGVKSLSTTDEYY
jgi:hypothetical protein